MDAGIQDVPDRGTAWEEAWSFIPLQAADPSESRLQPPKYLNGTPKTFNPKDEPHNGTRAKETSKGFMCSKGQEAAWTAGDEIARITGIVKGTFAEGGLGLGGRGFKGLRVSG